jgi:hypothetical protein
MCVDMTSTTQPSEVHNYGHGGTGVGLSWGCARDVVAQAHLADR